jgi:hypothetical protein
LEELVTIRMRNHIAVGADRDNTLGLRGVYVCRDVAE